MSLLKIQNYLRDVVNPAPVYPHRLFKNLFFDDSVRENMLDTGSAWVVERIFQAQLDERGLAYVKKQHWELRLWQDHSVFLICKDAVGNSIYFEHRDLVQTPKQDLSFVLEQGILRMAREEGERYKQLF